MITAIWHDLPLLLASPSAIFPSTRGDGSIVATLVIEDASGNPVVVPMQADAKGSHNAILSVYGKQAGWGWVEAQLGKASASNAHHYKKEGFAASVPRPEDLSSSSPGPIPADGTAKPVREILTLRPVVKQIFPKR